MSTHDREMKERERDMERKERDTDRKGEKENLSVLFLLGHFLVFLCHLT